MGFIELFLVAVGLSMDAFAVSVCSGLTMPKVTVKKALTIGLYFGLFQAGMPVIGYFAATLFAESIIAYDHWVAFGLLCFLGSRMIFGAVRNRQCPDRKCPAEKPCTDRECPHDNSSGEETSLQPSVMLPLAVATSIDALAIGVSFAFLQVNIIPAVSLIGITTLVLSIIGVKIGNLFGMKYKSRAEIIGGIILILIGLRVLFEHLGKGVE